MNAFVQAAPLRSIGTVRPAPNGPGTRPGAWNAGSLRALLSSTMQGDQVIVVSNRQPHAHELRGGSVQVSQSAGGLVTALEPIAHACARLPSGAA